MNSGRSSRALRFFAGSAVIFSGWLAGVNVDRFVVQFPAWRALGPATWAAYSRHADLANGLFLYPFEALGGFLVLVVSVILGAQRRHSKMGKRFLLLISLATVFSVIGLLFTFLAAPVMLSLRAGNNDPGFLQHALDDFYYWSFYRAIAQVLAFFFSVVAITATWMRPTGESPP